MGCLFKLVFDYKAVCPNYSDCKLLDFCVLAPNSNYVANQLHRVQWSPVVLTTKDPNLQRSSLRICLVACAK